METILKSDVIVSIEDLPREVICRILQDLDLGTLFNVSQTNKFMRKLVQSKNIWKQKYLEHFGFGSFLNQDDQILWREEFKTQYCLKKNWMEGKFESYIVKQENENRFNNCIAFVEGKEGNILAFAQDTCVAVIKNFPTNMVVTKLHGHEGEIICIEIYKNLLFSGGFDTTIRVWDLDSLVCLQKLSAHLFPPRCIKVCENTLVTGSWDATLILWKINGTSFEYVDCLKQHTSAVSCLEVKEDIIVSGSDDNTVIVWNLDGNLRHILRGHWSYINCVAFDKHANVVVSGSRDTTLRIWNLETGEPLHCFKYSLGEILSIVLNPNLADTVIASSSTGEINVYNINSGERITTVNNSEYFIYDMFYYSAFRLLVTCSYLNTIAIWKVEANHSLKFMYYIKVPNHSLYFVEMINNVLVVGSRNKAIMAYDFSSQNKLRKAKVQKRK